MTAAERYANKLQRDYGLDVVPVNLNDETYDTVDRVARKVLSDTVYQQWRSDFAREVNLLRKKFGIAGSIS